MIVTAPSTPRAIAITSFSGRREVLGVFVEFGESLSMPEEIMSVDEISVEEDVGNEMMVVLLSVVELGDIKLVAELSEVLEVEVDWRETNVLLMPTVTGMLVVVESDDDLEVRVDVLPVSVAEP